MPNWEQIANEIAEQAAKALKGEREKLENEQKKTRHALAAAAVFLAAAVVGWIV